MGGDAAGQVGWTDVARFDAAGHPGGQLRARRPDARACPARARGAGPDRAVRGPDARLAGRLARPEAGERGPVLDDVSAGSRARPAVPRWPGPRARCAARPGTPSTSPARATSACCARQAGAGRRHRGHGRGPDRLPGRRALRPAGRRRRGGGERRGGGRRRAGRSGLGGADPPGCVADVGAGTGYYLAAVLDRATGRAGLALDASKFAAAPGGPRPRPDRRRRAPTSGRRLPVADGAAALALSVFAPRHGAELRRVLHPAGRLLVVTPDSDHLGELAGPLGLLEVDPRKDERLTATAWPLLRPGRAAPAPVPPVPRPSGRGRRGGHGPERVARRPGRRSPTGSPPCPARCR